MTECAPESQNPARIDGPDATLGNAGAFGESDFLGCAPP
jgi:hypothetical protein